MDKQQKYDRQLRLWGDEGQRCLGNAKVCLINVTATGTEILKNIVLAGIGSFTIIDNKRITGEDMGNNFFLDIDRIGDSRAKVATEMLLELNPDVAGECIDDALDVLLESNLKLFSHFSVVVVSGSILTESLVKLSEILWEKEIPLLLCKSYGFLGFARLAVPEHCSIDSHPDNVHADLRLDCPFPELKEFCDSLDLDSMTYKEHSHVPYVVLLYKYLEKWKIEHGGMPKNWKEKSALKKIILDGMRKKESVDGSSFLDEEEENFLEAAKNLNVSLVSTKVPSTIQQIMNDDKCRDLELKSKNFWILARGLKMFVENEGQGLLPLRGNLPDMTADSERYLKLQAAYKTRADHDRGIVAEHVSAICADLGIENGRISIQDIKLFCKNASFLKVVRTRSISEEFTKPSKEFIDSLLSDPDSNSAWYVMFRAVDKFVAKHCRFPGSSDEQVEPDIGRLKMCTRELLEDWKVPNGSEIIKDDYVHEMTRCGAAELHPIASFMGGAVSHEIIKLVTGQYVPFNDTFLYNGLNCTTSTFKI